MNADFLALLPFFIPLCALAAGVLIAAIKIQPANKLADEDAADGQWNRLIAWNQRLQDECEACHRERDEARAEALKWKAAAEGVGIVRTAQSIADAEERQKRRKDGQ